MLMPDATDADVASRLFESAAYANEGVGNECLVFDARLASFSYGFCSRTNER